jgi:drug/metabolite transporter (DMT)-like permease
VSAVLFALASALLFGGMTVALRFALQAQPEADLGAVVTSAVAFVVVAAAVAIEPGTGELARPRELAVFALAGLLAPGLSQLLFMLAIRDAGSSRASVVVGTAPLFGATMAVALLGEPLEWPLALGAVLVVVAGALLVKETVRPDHFRVVGMGFALVTTLLFSTRDVMVRWYSERASLGSVEAAAAALAAGVLVVVAFSALARRGRILGALARPGLLRFVPAGVLFGLSYVLLFEAYYRGKVTVVSPLVATESLWTVLLSALLLRGSELVGARLVLGALLVVAGGALIGAHR